jgi:TetR/AcrR family transcriptional regulator, mexCD-oprJ operon repressor
VLHHVLKGAAADISGGRLDPADAPPFIVSTVLAAYTAAGADHLDAAFQPGCA